ncbi:iron-containing alcohol dehydrogenase [Clostridium sp. SYSU_GA19001]|uniref:iron-containing alcohol dehydrogenase n=1 Tax=Clostridium caldaquaticum TaxID=2940653 RepID=UPI002076FD41|nr:iron-containing alcohol dehydrogenase [Clostridium caldaquaticum]MCM8710124.1 iron-containing alcohol dehydrogenase [Clostridium caldaquaticum]
MSSFNMYIPTRTLFGVGMLNSLKDQAMPGKKALIVITNGKSIRENGYLLRVEEQLKLAGVQTVVFDKVEPNPLKTTVMAGAVFAKENGCDFIVALGGGSSMDASKAIAIMATNPGDLWDYVQSGTGKRKAIENKPLPIIAITTTAGTGSETDAGAVITNEETQEKVGIKDPRLFPVFAIVDPELMRTVPPKFTAFQGWDALSHSMEGYINNKTNLMSDMYAITAIENVSRYLARAVKDGNDMEARERVAFGNNLSGVVMCVGTTSSQHSLEHAMSAYHQDLPHGAGLIMLSKAYFTHFINKHVCDDRFIRMAKAMGMEDAKEPMDFITMLSKLQEECGIADLKMSDYGIKPEEFETFAHNAKDAMSGLFLVDRCELSIEDCIAIYEASFR